MFINFTKKSVSALELLHPKQTKCLKRAFDRITSNMFGAAVMKTTTKSIFTV